MYLEPAGKEMLSGILLISLLILYELYEAYCAERKWKQKTEAAKQLLLPLIAGLLLVFIFTIYLKVRAVIG